MKKSTKDFLINLEKRTSITIDWSNLEPTDKGVQKNGEPSEIDTLNVNNGRLIMMVHSCGCETCKEIIGMQIFYGLGSILVDAETVKKEIKKVAPQIPIEIFNLLDLNSIAQMIK
jgi:hypothetical protein